ncbi:hypothetical protein PPACK8108_LOCUS19570 [Phakopsora pachyrhizi]|uniref:Uncharacterized protein n=1 Tax=Phakopsora pachyrhizi TaxID=170000 RepID=A0AAV0BFV1_PHAPC|nr:hypothetical protein PPACK8108_LOCUS19570 [Phakopsora pachyrhizi]
MLMINGRLAILALLTITSSIVSAKNRDKRDNISLTIEKPQASDILGTLQPTGNLKLVTLGAGQQLYICNGTSWIADGAVADLYDITQKPELWRNITSAFKISKHEVDKELIKVESVEKGKHTFVADVTGSKAPKFQVGENVVLATKDAAMPSPFNPELNVPWLSLKVTDGDFAKSVLRVSTNGGFAPKAACRNSDPENPEEFKSMYSALYMFFG